MSMKEKFQITHRPIPVEDGENQWLWGGKTPNYQKDKFGVRVTTPKSTSVITNVETAGNLQQLPPGMDIDNQMRVLINDMPLVVAGANDVSGHLAALENQSTMSRGTSLEQFGATDDQYTGEHIDLFYGEAYGDDGTVGFVERNNYMDRL